MSELLRQVLIDCGCVRRGLLRLRIPHGLHRHTQPLARRNDQARYRPLQLADWQMGMGRAVERTEYVEGAVRRGGSR